MKKKIKISDFAIVKTLSALRISSIQDSMFHANIVVTSLARNYVTEKEIKFNKIKKAVEEDEFDFSDGFNNMRFYIKTQYIPENDFVEIEEFAAFSNGDFTKFNLKNKIRISLDSLIIEEALDYPAGKTLKKIAESFNGRTEIEKKICELLKTNKEQREI